MRAIWLGMANFRRVLSVGEVAGAIIKEITHEEYRAELPIGDHASALVLDGTLVHGSVVCAV